MGRVVGVWVVDGVVEESADVVDEDWVEGLRDLFFVGEFEGSFERDPSLGW